MFPSNSSGTRKKRKLISSHDSTDSNSKRQRISDCKLNKENENEGSSYKFDKFAYMLRNDKDDTVPTLFDIAAKITAENVIFQHLEEKYDGRIPENVQRRVLFWAFPRNESPLKLYSAPSDDESRASTSISNHDRSSFKNGLRLLENNCVEEPLQIGFHLSGVVRSMVTIDGERRPFRVSMSFDRCKITAVKCNCDHQDVYWCQHVVALALYRIRYPDRVRLCLPISESLNQMDRQQLQKFAQYLISKHYNEVLPTAQHLANEMLQLDSEINAIHGAPDPTAGPPIDDTDEHCWFLDESRMRSQIRCYLTNFSSSLDQFRQLFMKVKSMMRQRDWNGPRLLALITDQFFEHPWPGCIGPSGRSYLSPVMLEKCQNILDELGALWVLVVMDPYAKAERRSNWLDSLAKWASSPFCASENAFCSPNDMFCNAHVNQTSLPGIDNRKPKTVFHYAFEACSDIRWTNTWLKMISEYDFIQTIPVWNEPLPWACARVESLRAYGHNDRAIHLSIAIVHRMKDNMQEQTHERWLGHFLDPINLIFDCLMDAYSTIKSELGIDCRDLAMTAAILALTQPYRDQITCVYVRQKAAKQETGLLEKLKKIKMDDRLLQTIKKEINAIFPQHFSDDLTSETTSMESIWPTHSLANYLFQIFLPRDPDFAYGIALRALRGSTSKDAKDNEDNPESMSTGTRLCKTCQASAKYQSDSCQCSLAFNLLMAAKDDLERLKNILKVIRSNFRAIATVYRLAQSMQREAQMQPDGSTTKNNLLVVSFQLGLHVLTRTLNATNNAETNWFRADMIRWAVSCACMVDYQAMMSLTNNWHHFFSPVEAVGTVGPMLWNEILTSQFKYDNEKRDTLSKSVHRLAWDCASKSPSSCALHALSLCENDPVSFESIYVFLLDAGHTGRMAAEELFSISRYMERLSLTEKAFQVALLALSNARIGQNEEGSLLVGEVYWTCGLAHSLGGMEMSAVMNLIVERIQCASVLADILRRCAYPPIPFTHQLTTSNHSQCSVMATIAAHPDLRRLLSATMKAYADTIRSYLCHISPRHYGEFLSFLIKAKQIFALHEDGFNLFQTMLNQMKNGYKGKKKLMALIQEKFL